MGSVAGTELKAAIKIASTWNEAVAVGANDGFLFLPTGLKKDSGVDVDDSLGQYFSKDGTPGAIKVEGDIPAYLRYDGLDTFFALLMGGSDDPVQQGSTAAYAYQYDWLESNDGLFATYVKHMKNYIEEHPTIKIAGITIKGEVGKALQIIATVISVNKVTDSTTNTTTTYEDVTVYEERNRVKFSEGVFRINDQSGSALGSGNEVYPSSFELTAKRKLKGEYGQFKTEAPNVQDLIDEPTNDGPPEMKLKLTFPRHSDATYLDALGSDTRKKMDITFTGANIASSYDRSFTLEMPHMQLTNADPQDEAGHIKEPLEFLLHAVSIAPTGMTVTMPFRISGINHRTTDPLGGSEPTTTSTTTTTTTTGL